MEAKRITRSITRDNKSGEVAIFHLIKLLSLQFYTEISGQLGYVFTACVNLEARKPKYIFLPNTKHELLYFNNFFIYRLASTLYLHSYNALQSQTNTIYRSACRKVKCKRNICHFKGDVNSTEEQTVNISYTYLHLDGFHCPLRIDISMIGLALLLH